MAIFLHIIICIPVMEGLYAERKERYGCIPVQQAGR